jgi:hypothetical protein
MKKTFFALSAVFLCLKAAFASDSDVGVTPSGMVYYQFGQLVKTSLTPNQDAWPDKTWDQRAVFRAQLNARVHEHVQINVGLEFGMLMLVSPPVGDAATGSSTSNNIVDPLIAQGVYSFGDDPEHQPVRIALGYFPFKYDASANNMGEYLFRTGAYPPYIINTFDECQARLLGLHVTVAPIENLNFDVLFTNETFFMPRGDYSLSILGGYKLKNILDFGAGISLKSLVSVDRSQTTPRSAPIYPDSTGVIVGDTAFYSFKGTKLMGRASFDLKGFFESPNFFGLPFGPNDCKVYCETAILGWGNPGGYPGYFDSLAGKWPVMIGVDIPALNFLDVFSLEWEYTHVKYDKYKFNSTTPIDGIGSDSLNVNAGIRWSLYASKTFKNGFGVSGILGKDHFRPTPATSPWPGVDNPSQYGAYGSEMLIRNGDWHYALRLSYSF